MASAAAGQKALPAIAFKHTTAAATVASVSAPILLDIGRDLSPSPPRPAAGDAACCTALLPAITGGEHSLALPPSAYLSHQTPLQPQIPCRLQHVIANQCAHWCGNPRPPAERWYIAAAPGCAHTCQVCHCEPVRTLVWQSASPQRNLASWLLFWRIRMRFSYLP